MAFVTGVCYDRKEKVAAYEFGKLQVLLPRIQRVICMKGAS